MNDIFVDKIFRDFKSVRINSVQSRQFNLGLVVYPLYIMGIKIIQFFHSILFVQVRQLVQSLSLVSIGNDSIIVH